MLPSVLIIVECTGARTVRRDLNCTLITLLAMTVRRRCASINFYTSAFIVKIFFFFTNTGFVYIFLYVYIKIRPSKSVSALFRCFFNVNRRDLRST